MAIVQVSWRAGRSEEQKRSIAKGITNVLVSHGSWRERVVVVFADIPADSYAIGGVTLKDEAETIDSDHDHS